MAKYACGRCGAVSEVQPCVACGGPAFDLDDPAERENLRFTLSRQSRLRAGTAALIGCGIGLGLAILLDTRYLLAEPLPYLVAVAFALVAVLTEPRARAELGRELDERAGRASSSGRSTALALAGVVLAIVVRIGLVVWARASTMPRAEAERLVSTRTCDIANRCSKAPTLCDITGQISVMLARPSARVDRDTVDACLKALDEQERRHEACSAPAPPACLEVSSETVPKLLQRGRELEHDVDRAIEQQLHR